MSCCPEEKALVLFSGGQDSTTCLAWALARFAIVETIGFHYGQRHVVELDCRAPIFAALRSGFQNWDTRLGHDQVIDLRLISDLSVTALTGDTSTTRTDGLPATFVPGRNLIFMTVAAIVAEQRGIKHLVGGMCETDYSGYPDCRDDTLKALQVAVNLGLNSRLVIHTPLMLIDKMQTWQLAEELGGRALVDIMVESTHTCYVGDRAHRHPWGYGCGACDACNLRSRGWERFTEWNARK